MVQAAGVALELRFERTILEGPKTLLEQLQKAGPAFAAVAENLVRAGVRERGQEFLVLLVGKEGLDFGELAAGLVLVFQHLPAGLNAG